MALRKRPRLTSPVLPSPGAGGAGNDRQLVVRLPGRLMRRIDHYAAELRAELPGTRFARAEAVRLLLTQALDRAGRPRAKGAMSSRSEGSGAKGARVKSAGPKSAGAKKPR